MSNFNTFIPESFASSSDNLDSFFVHFKDSMLNKIMVRKSKRILVISLFRRAGIIIYKWSSWKSMCTSKTYDVLKQALY